MEYSLYQTFLDKIKSHFQKGNGFRYVLPYASKKVLNHHSSKWVFAETFLSSSAMEA
ncbi:hypothetical protein EH2_00103 [Bacillus subtilis]|nr:hypothetical protein EH2_00103 [Bacillus subtilis]